MRFPQKQISKYIRPLFRFIFFVLCTNSCSNQESFNVQDYFSKSVLKSERENFLIKTINETILGNLSYQLSDSTEKNYQSAFWAMELIQFRNSFCDSIIKNCFIDLKSRSQEFQKSFLELLHTLYKYEFLTEITYFSKGIDNPKLFAMCLNNLKKSDLRLDTLLHEYLKKYPKQADNPNIIMLKNYLSNDKRPIPSLMDLLRKDFGKNNTVIISLQRSNRDYPGLLIIKKSDGKFLRDESGNIFYVQQLARALTDLPGYITNGNTPEGIFSIQGIGFSKNDFIGPSPNLQLVLPFEVNLQEYFHSELTDSIWNIDYYKNLLPKSWQNYLSIYEAYYSGEAGRNEIIAHGTTIDPSFYSNESFFPFTPSLGCLTTKEIWSPVNGKIIESDQIKFMNAFINAGSGKGFFIVVNIDDQQSPVTFDEIKSFIF